MRTYPLLVAACSIGVSLSVLAAAESGPHWGATELSTDIDASGADALASRAPSLSAQPTGAVDYLLMQGTAEVPFSGTAAAAPPGYIPPLELPPDRHFTSTQPLDPFATSAAAPPGVADAEPAPADGVPEGCVDCRAGDIFENEPVCANGYIDNFNGGCNSTPNVFSTIDCGQSVCGQYGTFLSSSGANFRDTDWYRFTLIQPATVTWTAVGEATTRVFLLSQPCPASLLATGVGAACQPASVTATLAAGTYVAFVATDVFTGVPCGSKYRATLTIDPCCVEPCQVGDIPEGEPDCANGYIDNFNGGCNSTPNVFGSVDCGQVICGRYGTFLSSSGTNFRDTDWYRFTIPVASNVSWSARGEAATRLFIMQGTCPAVTLGTAVAPACQNVTVSLNNLAAGTYFVFVGTDVFTGVPCGSKYRATLMVDPCCPGPCQPGDLVEGEPDCANGYIDNFNGGCNSTPNVFSTIDCGRTVCGKYGTFLNSSGGSIRDTDWYRFTITQPSNVTWSAVGQAVTRIFLLSGVCPTASLATASAPACQPVSVSVNNLPAGTYFVFVGPDVFTGVPCGSKYRAMLTVDPCCPVNCLPGDIAEGEPDCANGYIDTYNGGCNSNPNVFSNIECNDTICGRYGTFLNSGGGNTRDTDWYRFTITQADTITWTVTGQASTAAFLLTGTCPTAALGSATAAPCQPATVTVNLPAGTYYAFAATSVFNGVPCGSKYRAELTGINCCPCDPPGPINPDRDGDCDVDSVDLNIVLTSIPCPPGPCAPGDADGDGDADTTDLNIILTSLPCP